MPAETSRVVPRHMAGKRREQQEGEVAPAVVEALGGPAQQLLLLLLAVAPGGVWMEKILLLGEFYCSISISINVKMLYMMLCALS